MNQVYSYRRPCPVCGRMVSYYENDMGHAWASCPRCGWTYDAIPVIGPDGRLHYRISDSRPALAAAEVALHNPSLPGDDKAREAGLHNSFLPGDEERPAGGSNGGDDEEKDENQADGRRRRFGGFDFERWSDFAARLLIRWFQSGRRQAVSEGSDKGRQKPGRNS